MIKKLQPVFLILLSLVLIIVAGCGTGNAPDSSDPMASVDTPTTDSTTADVATTTTTTDGTFTTTSAETTTAQTEGTTTTTTTKASTTSKKTSATQTTTADKKPTSTTAATTTTTQKLPEVPTAAEKRDRIGFGFYRMPSIDRGLLDVIELEAAKGHVNVYQVDMNFYYLDDTIKILKKIQEVDGMAWMSVGAPIFNWGTVPRQVIDDWDKHLKAAMDVIEEHGLTDVILGFYFDEPMLNQIPKTTFRDVTKRLREMYPEMRTFACFAVNAVSPDIWSNGNDQVIDYDTALYLTDAAYDMYWEVTPQNIRKYKKVTTDLQQRIGRSDVRIWFVPCIMNYGNSSWESFCVDHLELMYELLKSVPNPGGLLCYAYDIANRDGSLGNIGFNEMRDREDNPWLTLEDRLVAIGREIVNGNKK